MARQTTASLQPQWQPHYPRDLRPSPSSQSRENQNASVNRTARGAASDSGDEVERGVRRTVGDVIGWQSYCEAVS